MKKISFKILLLLLFFSFFFLVSDRVFAQSSNYNITNQGAPNTEQVIRDALDRGETLDQAIADAQAYLASPQGGGWSSQVIHESDGSIIIQCDNGEWVKITPNAPPPTQPPPETTAPLTQPPPTATETCNCKFVDTACTIQGQPGTRNCKGSNSSGTCVASASCGNAACGPCVVVNSSSTPAPAPSIAPTNVPSNGPTNGPTNVPPITVFPSGPTNPFVTPSVSIGPTGPTQPPFSPTPTPQPFSSEMCKCAGIFTTGLIAGQDALVTAYGRVTGSDRNFAAIPKIQFSAAKDNLRFDRACDTDQDPLCGQPTTRVRPNEFKFDTNADTYKATWLFHVPSDIDPNAVYRVWANNVCQKKQPGAGAFSVGTSQLPKQNIFQKILSWFGGLFNQTKKLPLFSIFQAAPTPTPNQNLQLQSLNSAEPQYDQSTCQFLFHFSKPQNGKTQ